MAAGFVDIHNHLLPGIDDGAANMADALALARAAVVNGISHCVCTPHMHQGRFNNNRDSISVVFGQFKSALTKANIPLRIAMAAEVRFGLEVMSQVKAEEIPFLGLWLGKPVLLLEFPHNDIPFGADKLTQWLFRQGIVPMIAHPERNRAAQYHYGKLKPFIEQGCLLQLTAASLTGYFGKPAQLLAGQLLKEGVVTILASDAHNLRYRPPMLNEGKCAAASIVGDDVAWKLASLNPWLISEPLFKEKHRQETHSACSASSCFSLF